MKILTSAQLTFPAFHQTIFREVNALPLRNTEIHTLARDAAITRKFIHFLTHRDQNKPFFGFLLFDAAHNYCGNETPPKHPFKPWQKKCNRLTLTPDDNPLHYHNRYLNAVHFVDEAIHPILEKLKTEKLLDNTIVIITADHGEEINDNYSGYWEHASAYTHYQLHVPMIIHWPHRKPQILKHFTSHYDMAPTLLSEVFACQNPSSDYALGHSLFTPHNRDFLIAGSYGDYGIINDAHTLRIYLNGDHEINDLSGHPLTNLNIKMDHLHEAIQLINRFIVQ